MKAIICGAGDVGSSIAKYLSEEKHQVVLIDTDNKKLKELECSLDIQTIAGPASSPEILERAGARDADLLIGVTRSDEVNMISCLQGASLFNIPLKIARIRSEFYGEYPYEKLLDDLHIDVVISPEHEVAKSIVRNLKIPGALEFIYLHNKKTAFLGAKCMDAAPFIGTRLTKIPSKIGHFPFSLVMLIRDGEKVELSSKETLKVGDELYAILPAKYANDFLEGLGHRTKVTRKIVIFGGGRVGLNLSKLIEQENVSTRLTLVEKNDSRAVYLAKQLTDTLVIKGSGLDEAILTEADIDMADAVVSVTGEDEDNILLSLIAKQHQVRRTFALINKPIYSTMMSHLGVDAIIDPNAVTISTILQHIRKGQVQSIYSLKQEVGELMEIKVLKTSKVAGHFFEKIKRPKGVDLCAVIRNGELMETTSSLRVEADDIVIVLAQPGEYKTVEKLFSAGLFFF